MPRRLPTVVKALRAARLFISSFAISSGESVVNTYLTAFGGDCVVNTHLADFGGESLVNVHLAHQNFTSGGVFSYSGIWEKVILFKSGR